MKSSANDNLIGLRIPPASPSLHPSHRDIGTDGQPVKYKKTGQQTAGIQTNTILTEGHRDCQINIQTDRQTDRHTDRQINQQTH